MKFKNISEIIGRMTDLILINQSSNGLNDFTEGSTLQTLLEAISMEIFQYYLLQKSNINEAIPQGIFEAFDFEQKEARRAYGEVTLTFSTANSMPMYIPRGTRFMSRRRGYDQTYELLEDYYIPSNTSSATVTIYCTQVGELGNIPKHTIDTAGTNLANLRGVSNESDFLTGQDKEPIENVKNRFRLFVDTRGRATNKAIEYAVRNVPDVTGVYVDESTGWIRVYAHDNSGNLPASLKQQVEQATEIYRPSGIRLTVLPIEKIDLTFALDVTVRGAENAESQVLINNLESLVRQFINRHEAGEDIVIQEVYQQVMSYDDDIIYDVSSSSITENVLVNKNEIARTNNVNVNLVLYNEEELRDQVRFDV